MTKIKTLFLDIGGVLLTNGWDHLMRRRLIDQFGLVWDDFEKRHRQVYDTHEQGKITLDEYLTETIFWKKRNFTLEDFKEAMCALTQAYPKMMNLVIDLKKQYRLRVAAVSNEGAYLAEYRIKTFQLNAFIDDFFISCFVGVQKPDPRIYQIALDVTQTPKDSVIYVDDRPNLIEAAQKVGLVHCVLHTSMESTRDQLHLILRASYTQEN